MEYGGNDEPFGTIRMRRNNAGSRTSIDESQPSVTALQRMRILDTVITELPIAASVEEIETLLPVQAGVQKLAKVS